MPTEQADRIAGLEQEVADLTKALTGLTCGGSEFFIRRGERFVADIPACVFGSHEGSGCMFENPANAPLIAAAPDLLGALKGAMAAINAAIQLGMAEAQGHERTAAKLDSQIEAARANARAAIAKASPTPPAPHSDGER